MCKLRRRRAFVLVEVLIATSLFAVLLVAIFSIFWRTSKLSDAITQKRLRIEQVLLIETKLQNVFNNIIHDEESRSYFYLEPSRQNGSPSLVFTFDNQFHVDYAYTTTVLGKLHVDNENLYLTIWPHFEDPKERPQNEMRKELLLEKVSDVSLELFASSESKDEKNQDKAVNGPRPVQWNTVWPKEYETRPSLIKLAITLKGQSVPITLWFMLPQEVKTISYDSRRVI